MGVNKDRGRYLLSRCNPVSKSVKVAVPNAYAGLKWDRLECIECSSQPHWLVIDSKNQGYYVCQTCKEEFYEA